MLGNKRDSLASGSTRGAGSAGVSSGEMQKQLQMTEELFNHVIIELQKDRMALKG